MHARPIVPSWGANVQEMPGQDQPGLPQIDQFRQTQEQPTVLVKPPRSPHPRHPRQRVEDAAATGIINLETPEPMPENFRGNLFRDTPSRMQIGKQSTVDPAAPMVGWTDGGADDFIAKLMKCLPPCHGFTPPPSGSNNPQPQQLRSHGISSEPSVPSLIRAPSFPPAHLSLPPDLVYPGVQDLPGVNEPKDGGISDVFEDDETVFLPPVYNSPPGDPEQNRPCIRRSLAIGDDMGNGGAGNSDRKGTISPAISHTEPSGRGNGSPILQVCAKPKLVDRRPSFEKLEAMIPGFHPSKVVFSGPAPSGSNIRNPGIGTAPAKSPGSTVSLPSKNSHAPSDGFEGLGRGGMVRERAEKYYHGSRKRNDGICAKPKRPRIPERAPVAAGRSGMDGDSMEFLTSARRDVMDEVWGRRGAAGGEQELTTNIVPPVEASHGTPFPSGQRSSGLPSAYIADSSVMDGCLSSTFV